MPCRWCGEALQDEEGCEVPGYGQVHATCAGTIAAFRAAAIGSANAPQRPKVPMDIHSRFGKPSRWKGKKKKGENNGL